MLLLAFLVVVIRAQDATSAIRVYRQGSSGTSFDTNGAGTSPTSLRAPYGIALGNGGVFVADSDNNRGLFFAGSSVVASVVYGQEGDFTSQAAPSPPNASSLRFPYDFSRTASYTFLVDSGNHRVLRFLGDATVASAVYGQSGALNTATANKGGISADSLFFPQGVCATSSGVYIVDQSNNRVLYYDGDSTTATRVYGQPDMSIGFANSNGPSATSLEDPVAVAVSQEGVYISDNSNNRVLFFPGDSTTATRVYGQDGDFTTTAANNGGLSAMSLSGPFGIAVRGSELWVADSNNNRILYYEGSNTTAKAVYGQLGAFDTGAANKGGLSADSLSFPTSLAVGDDTLYASDYNNERVLAFRVAVPTTTNGMTTTPAMANCLAPAVAFSVLVGLLALL